MSAGRCLVVFRARNKEWLNMPSKKDAATGEMLYASSHV